MSYQLELRHLRYFQAVAEELSFRKAAERLFISQPGLSRQIRQMEESMETVLLERTKRSVRLTPAGEYLKSEIEFLFNHLEKVQKQTRLYHEGLSGEIRIGFVGSAIHGVLPLLMTRLSTSLPGLVTQLQELPNHEQIESIQKDKLDIGFVRVSSVPEDLVIRPVQEECFALVLPRDHPMTAAGFRHIGQLKDEKFILFSTDYSPEYYDKVISICRDQGFEPLVSHRSVHAFTIFKLVENHLGIAIVPASLLDGYSLQVKAIALTSIPQRTTLSVIWKKDNRNAAMQRAVQLVFDN